MTQLSYKTNLEISAAAFNPAHHSPASGVLGWRCPSNIAIIKYWGKQKEQIPMNPSLSITLSEAITTTTLEYQFNPGTRSPELEFRFHGKIVPEFEQRIRLYLQRIGSYLPVVKHTHLKIESTNSFPHSSGIASSASAMGALALCLVELQSEFSGTIDSDGITRMASFIARLGSGSASRSLFPKLAIWGFSGTWPGSSNEYAIPVTEFHKNFSNMRDTILVVESGQKKVSSSAGHALMETNPFSRARFKQASLNLDRLKRVITNGNWDTFIEIMEEEALSLHAMMMTGKPGYLLMQPGTLATIDKVREYRKDTGMKIGFTLDAGANVHILYDTKDASRIDEFIIKELVQFCEDERIIWDRMGNGPVKTVL